MFESARKGLVFLIAAMFVLSLACGKDKKGPSAPVAPTPEELIQAGWTAYETGDFAPALQDFDLAIAAGGNLGAAYVGQGWTRLALSVSTADLAGALTSFDNAQSRGQTGTEVKAGRAVVLLALGEGHLASAITEARAARTSAPTFVFSHRTTFTVEDLRLVEAVAQAGLGQFALALEAANQILPSGISATDRSTWTVGGIAYSSFEDAVLAFLFKVSEETSG